MEAGFIFHGDNAPVHNACIIRDFLATKEKIEMMDQTPYSPDLAPCDFFLFPKLKNNLAGKFLTVETFKTKWDGVNAPLTKHDYIRCYAKWVERHRKCCRFLC